jgi:uncharacterized membrane protein
MYTRPLRWSNAVSETHSALCTFGVGNSSGLNALCASSVFLILAWLVHIPFNLLCCVFFIVFTKLENYDREACMIVLFECAM